MLSCGQSELVPSVNMGKISKTFEEKQALDGVDFQAFPGEVHALIGENGAGKSTLMRILSGLILPDSGSMVVEGQKTRFALPRDARQAGVGMVHQEFLLVPAQTVLENLCLGNRFAGTGARLPRGHGRRKLKDYREKTGLVVEEDILVEDLSVGVRQKVEILKVLLRGPEILIFDEPTSVLAPKEISDLMSLFRILATDGKTVIFITHKLNEVMVSSDRVTVLKQGRVVCRTVPEETDIETLSEVMVGKDLGKRFRKAESRGGVIAELTSVHVFGGEKEKKLVDVNLVVRSGEMIGIAGIEGNGQQELAEILSALRLPDMGTAVLPEEIGFIPDDRLEQALIGHFSILQNIALGLINNSYCRLGPLVLWGKVAEYVQDLILSFGIKSEGPHEKVGDLSGGNQQKVVLARELERSKQLLVARNPTQGLDVKASKFFYQQMSKLLGRGLRSNVADRRGGVVLISSDLDEILTFADEIYVLYDGELMQVPTELASRELVGRLMLTGKTEFGGLAMAEGGGNER